MLNVDNFRGKNLDLTECQGTRWHGDNPLTPFCGNTFTTHSPTFYHRYGYVDSIKTTLFPLTLSGRPLFYYVYSPDKKGRVSVERGEVNVVNVRRLLLPLQRGTDLLFKPQRDDQSMSLRNKDK
jgi:hypothetical protein